MKSKIANTKIEAKILISETSGKGRDLTKKKILRIKKGRYLQRPIC